jgi:hypothetical protein
MKERASAGLSASQKGLQGLQGLQGLKGLKEGLNNVGGPWWCGGEGDF